MPIASPESSEGVDAGHGSKNTQMKRIYMNTFNDWASVERKMVTSVYQEKKNPPALVGPSFLFPSSQIADRWKTWCFSSYWTCAESLGCCWSCCHLRRDWDGQRKSLRGKHQNEQYTVLFYVFNVRLPYLRNSRGSSSIAPGWVSVILSSRSARGVEGGVESRRARDRSSSLLFCRAKCKTCNLKKLQM